MIRQPRPPARALSTASRHRARNASGHGLRPDEKMAEPDAVGFRLETIKAEDVAVGGLGQAEQPSTQRSGLDGECGATTRHEARRITPARLGGASQARKR